RHANLFEALLEYLDIGDQAIPLQGNLYGCSLLPRGKNGRARIDAWLENLQIGALLPTLPLWLRDDLAVPLELELTYEETCGDLRACRREGGMALLIKNGGIVTADSRYRADIACDGETIARIGPGLPGPAGAELIDA